MPEVRVELNIAGAIGADADYPTGSGYFLYYKGVQITNAQGIAIGPDQFKWGTPDVGFNSGGYFYTGFDVGNYTKIIPSAVVVDASIGRVISQDEFANDVKTGVITPLPSAYGPDVNTTTIYDSTKYLSYEWQYAEYQVSYGSHAWQLLNVGVTTTDKYESGNIGLAEGPSGSVTTPATDPSPIRFTDVHPIEKPFATFTPAEKPTAATPTGLALPVSSGLIAAVEAGFSLGDVTYANGSGSVGWSFDPSSLNTAPFKVAPNEVVNLKETVTVNDTTDAPDTAIVDITIQGPDHIPEYDDAALKYADIFNKFYSEIGSLGKVPNLGTAVDRLLAYQSANHVDSQLDKQLAAAGNDSAAQYLAYENAAVSVPEAAIKFGVISLVGLVVVEFGLAGATLVAAPVVGAGVAGAVLTGAALDAIGISAAAEITTALVGTALALAITEFVAKVGIGFGLDAAYDAVLKDPVDAYLRGLFEQQVPFDSFQAYTPPQDQDPPTPPPTDPSTPPASPPIDIPPLGSNPVPGDPGSTIDSGTATIVASGQTATGVTVAQGGALQIAAGGTLQFVTIAGGTVEIAAGAITPGQVRFSGPGGRLQIDSPIALPPIISGFGPGDVINLNDVPFDPNGTVTLLPGNVLDVIAYGGERRIALDPTEDFSGEYFHLSDPVGTDITVDDNPLCFTTGTHIRTARGEVAVEDLRVGDRAVTASGALRPVVWVGHRTLGGAGVPLRFAQAPVRVLAGAFGPDAPCRDLLLSPGHPVLVGADEDGAGGHLVPIMCLVNGTTVERETREAITYWHVELDAHDVLLAEGLPAESFLDWGDRGFFAGAGGILSNPDHVVPGLAGRCRPVAVDGPVVEAERRRLDAVFALDLAAACAWPSADALDLGL